jgi:aryl carrier-like protein
LVLDANLQPVGPGERGELCVTGPQVARGYRNLPELTAQKFVADHSAPGGRLYRTGDIGYFLPNGELAFCGRLDDQIKIRGFRVEPDEIVARLNEHPEIRNSVVVARSESSVAAYVIFSDGSSLSDRALREFLRSRLPDYSIPSVFVRLDAIPMTSTGKCDKAALPAPSRDNILGGEGDSHAVQQQGTEDRVAQLVSGLLDSRHIDRHENFFMAGGHSMLAAQLLARIRESFGARVTLRQLFEAPTVADLAAVVDAQLRSH